jgi:lysozyme
MMRISQNGLDLIKQHEAFRAEPYLCPARKLTIGYGHVILPGEKFTSITSQQAEELLCKDVALTEICINKYVKAPLTQNQFDALASFIFNIGRRNFLTSTMLKELNAYQTA